MKNLNALVYLRVSTEEQAEKGYSIQAQRTEGVNKAVELGCSPEDIHVFGDEGVSGAVLERPQLMAALDMLKRERNNIDFFICYDSSRLSRNAAHQLIIVDEIKKNGTELIFIKNSYKDNAEGRFQLTVMAAVDEYERARLKLRMEMGKRAKASQHKLTHNPGLYGYNFDPVTDTLSINEEHAENLRLIFRLLTYEHMGPAEIAEKLNGLDVPSPRMKQWSRVTIRRILSNPSYLGILYIRRYDTRDYHLNKYKKKCEKIKVKERPQEEWIPVQIPQIVDEDTWERAQSILKKSKILSRKRDKADYLLTPLIRCGICGSAMNGKSIVKDNSRYRYYICSGKYKEIKENRCEAILLKAEDIEKVIWDNIYRSVCCFIQKEMDFEKLIEEYVRDNEKNIINILIKKEKIDNEKKRIMTLFQKGYINEKEMGKKLESQEKKLLKLSADEVRIGEKDAGLTSRVKQDLISDKLPFIIVDILDKLDYKSKKLIVGLLVSEITVTGNTISVKARF